MLIFAPRRVNMSITVIIVNWNSGTFLAECLHRLNRQTLQPTRVLVVDNHSSDHSLNCIGQYADHVTVLPMESNLGFAAGNNYALSRCDTEFVALLNPDVLPADDWLECLLGAARRHPEFSAFGSRQCCQNDPDVLDGIGDIYHVSGLAWRNRYGFRQQKQDLTSREIFSPCAAAALYRRQDFIDAGGFDEDFFCYMEDIDMGFRLRLNGHKAMYVPEAVVLHAGAASTGNPWSDFAVYHGFRNAVWVFIKNMPGVLFWLLLPLHIMMNLLVMLFFSIRGQGNVILKAIRDAMIGILPMWRKRHSIQTNRVISIGDVWKLLDKRIFPPIRSHGQRKNLHCQPYRF